MNALALAVALVVFPTDALDFNAWMSTAGWASKREDPKGWEVGGGALHMISRGNSALIATERGLPKTFVAGARLRLKLRVASVPRETDLTRKSGDDAALRVYLAFDRGGGVFAPPNSIAYTWTEKEATGALIQSSHFSNLKYISIGSGPTPGTDWIIVERDLAADYHRAFPGEATLPRLKGLLLKCDSNDTKSSAESWLSTVELIAP